MAVMCVEGGLGVGRGEPGESWENGSVNQMRDDDGWAVLVETGAEIIGWMWEILRRWNQQNLGLP